MDTYKLKRFKLKYTRHWCTRCQKHITIGHLTCEKCRIRARNIQRDKSKGKNIKNINCK